MSRSAPILVVDDDESILSLVQLTLEQDGYAVVTAQDGSEALDLLEHLVPALILLDMRMPRVNGMEFARAYRESAASRAPIVVMTAAKDAAERAAQIDAAAYLGKPFDLDDLVDVVHKHTRNWRH